MKHLVSAMLITLTLAACGDEETTGPGQTLPPAVVSVVVTPASATLVSLGETVQLTASAHDASGNTISGKTFTWSSEDEGVATVSTSGLVTAVSNGSTNIMASASGVTSNAVVVTVTGIVAVGAGFDFSCALRSDGAAFCWGANGRGQLGDGTTTPSAVPVPVSGNHTFGQLIVGDVNACGLTAGGSAHCWGDNQRGQLGAGLPTGLDQISSVPVPVSGGHSFNNLSVGLRTVCGVATDGVTYCWGYNSGGQLGNGTRDSSNVPVAVSNSASLGFVTVSQGFTSTCALDGAGAAFCWGDDGGQFGNGTTVSSSLTPTSAASGMTLARIESGIFYTCGLDGGGGAFCWGIVNFVGQQGNGSFVEPVLSPTAVVGGRNFASLDAHNNNSFLAATCGITTSNEGWCWGDNEKGQLGGPSAETCNIPNLGDRDCSSVPIEVSGNIQFTSVAVGIEHMCALAVNGGVFCWGDNEFGQLGDGTMVNSPVPVAVLGLGDPSS